MQPIPSCAASSFMRATNARDAARDVLGERDRGVVAGGQQQAVEHASPGARACPSGSTPTFEPADVDRLLGDEHRRARRRRLAPSAARSSSSSGSRCARARCGLRCHSTRPVSRSNSSPARGGVVEGDVHRVLPWVAEPRQRERRLRPAAARSASASAGDSAVQRARVHVSVSACRVASEAEAARRRATIARAITTSAGDDRQRPARRRRRAPARAPSPRERPRAAGGSASGVMKGERWSSVTSRRIAQRADDPDPEQHEDEDRDDARQRKALFGHRAEGQEGEAGDEQERGAEDEAARCMRR